MYTPVITIAAYKRYDYTKRVLDALKNCRGIEKYKVLAKCEPGFQPVIDLLSSHPLNVELRVNKERVGCNRNIYETLRWGFSISDYVIMVEDDIVMAPDALEYFEYCRDTYRNDKSVFDVSSYNREDVAINRYHSLYRHKWFTPWGWATWEDRWLECAQGWNLDPRRAGVAWDDAVCQQIRNGRYEIRPRLARTQNIGAELGSWENPIHHAKEVFNKCWAGSVDVPAGTFVEEQQ